VRGPRWEIVVSSGVIRVQTRDYALPNAVYIDAPFSPTPPANANGMGIQEPSQLPPPRMVCTAPDDHAARPPVPFRDVARNGWTFGQHKMAVRGWHRTA
jgi:hypothetical protein